MTSVAEKRRRKKNKGLLGIELADTPRREKNGRTSRKDKQRDPSIPALKTRCRQMGKELTAENMRDMRAPWNGCHAGRSLSQTSIPLDADDRAGLWDAICHMRRTQAAFDVAIGAPKRHAACLRLLRPVEAMEADASTPPLDERSPEERQRDATRALMQIEGWLGYVDGTTASIAKRAVIDDEAVRNPDAIVRALQCILEGMRGLAVTWRGQFE
ncbi:hypothetical protein [Falsirhodobacter halotolerans]|uniref:hypothetical protein n=1 Tax=Falsirhodobacter halotolerans TaxID=1146892 RepID=UPI001FD338F2|nr:hypothetical protein [Falsirhodobacter halotolerans]MCJ8139578.1 hypothetical protein [Falsirhodobacter halotolerans]